MALPLEECLCFFPIRILLLVERYIPVRVGVALWRHCYVADQLIITYHDVFLAWCSTRFFWIFQKLQILSPTKYFFPSYNYWAFLTNLSCWSDFVIGRQMKVKCGGAICSPLPVTSGVFQGSVLALCSSWYMWIITHRPCHANMKLLQMITSCTCSTQKRMLCFAEGY